MSPNGLSVWLPAWNRGISLRARTWLAVLLSMSGADNVRSTPAVGGKVHPFSFRARVRFMSRMVRPSSFGPGGPCRNGACERGSCRRFLILMSAVFSTRGRRFSFFTLRVIIHKMATPPVQTGNATICAR